ncbi:Fatty-acid synthase/3-oxoacyl-[acyl-carrier-protein] reductase, partial [Scytalidium lignicola]
MADSRVAQVVGHLSPSRPLLIGQTAIVTGAGQGIGAEIARLFVNEGARVVISDIDSAKANEVAGQLNGLASGKALAIPGDITDSTNVENLVKKAAKFGNGKIHILVNNAGFTWDAVLHKTTDKQWDTMLALHCTAPFRIIRAAAPYFRVKDGEPRCIVNISSASGLHGSAGQANYAMAKSGLVGLTKTICKEWGPQFGVRANTVSFGAVNTRLTRGKEDNQSIIMADGTKVALGIPGANAKSASGTRYADIPLQRAASATEAASAVLAVVSPFMSYVTGQTIEVTDILFGISMSFSHKVYIVTGASSGIGKATALLLAQEGAKVGLFDINSPVDVESEILQSGGVATALKCDVRSSTEVEGVIKSFTDIYGPLDGAANLAGVIGPGRRAEGMSGSLIETSDEEWNRVLDINLGGVKNCLRAELRYYNPAGCSIVNASSISARIGSPWNAAYSASKAAVSALTKSVAQEMGGYGVRINAIAPVLKGSDGHTNGQQPPPRNTKGLDQSERTGAASPTSGDCRHDLVFVER